MIGATVSHYRIVSKLGEGGMGVVYEAEDLTLGRRVALKFCSSGRDDEKLRANLLKEARAASSLSHPNIATRSSPWNWCPAPACGASSASGN